MLYPKDPTVKVTREPGCLRFDWPLQRSGDRVQLIATAQNVVRTGGPLPPNRSLEMAAPDVVQFFAMRVSSARNSGSYSFNCVYALDRDHQVWLVAKNLPSGFPASQICHELEDFYGIEDMEVYGVTTDPSHPGPRR